MLEFANAGPQKPRSPKALDAFFVRHLPGVKLIYDHGCGFGGWTNHISQLTGAQVAIFDPDQEASAYTRSLLADRYSEAQAPYDAILCFGVLELFDEAGQLDLLRQFARDLRGNRLLVQYNFYNPIALRWLAIRLRHGDPVEWHEKNRFHRSYMKRAQVEDLFRKAGFSILEKQHPALENHLPASVNNVLGPIVPSMFHMTFFYALEKN